MKKIMMALAIIMVISIVAFGAIAYQGNKDIKGPNYNVDVHELLEEAIESCDYEAFVRIRTENNLPMKGKMFQVLNADNFCKFKEMHEANLAGDTAKAQEIRNDLGLGQGMMRGKTSKGTCSHQEQAGQYSGCQGKRQGSNQLKNFVDADANGICDNMQ